MLGVRLADCQDVAVTHTKSLRNLTFTASEFRVCRPAPNVRPMGSAIECDASAPAHEEGGSHKGLKPRQLQMIAIGGAIGTGLFMGAGGRLHNAGPGLFLRHAFCGIFLLLI